MKIVIAADHGGFGLKSVLISHLRETGNDITDLGAFDENPSDYPDYALAVARAITSGQAERAIFVCGSGVGASVAANKFPGLRAAVCHDTFSARQGVEDDDLNVLCLGARVIGPELAKEVVGAFLAACFSGLERHVRRVGKVLSIEREFMKTVSGPKP